MTSLRKPAVPVALAALLSLCGSSCSDSSPASTGDAGAQNDAGGERNPNGDSARKPLDADGGSEDAIVNQHPGIRPPSSSYCAEPPPLKGVKTSRLDASNGANAKLWESRFKRPVVQEFVWKTTKMDGLNVKVNISVAVMSSPKNATLPLRRLHIVNGATMGLEPTGPVVDLIANLQAAGELPALLVVWFNVEDLVGVKGGDEAMHAFLSEMYPAAGAMADRTDPVWVLGLEPGAKMLNSVYPSWASKFAKRGSAGSKRFLVGFNIDFWCTYDRSQFLDHTAIIGASIFVGEELWAGARVAFSVGDDVTYELSSDCGRRLQTPHTIPEQLIGELAVGGPARYVSASGAFNTKAIVREVLADHLRFILKPDVCSATGSGK